MLSYLVKENGLNNWKFIAHQLYKRNNDKNKIFRTAKQCKERWTCYENPLIKKGQWNLE